MSCRGFNERLPLYCGGDLRWWERLWIGWHLRRCANCRNELAGLSRARAAFCAAIEHSGTVEPAADLWSQVRRRVAVSDQVPPVPARHGRRLPGLPRLAAPAIGAAAILLVVLHQGGDHEPWRSAPWPEIAPATPTFEYVAQPGTTVMTYQTAEPGVSICWFFHAESVEE